MFDSFYPCWIPKNVSHDQSTRPHARILNLQGLKQPAISDQIRWMDFKIPGYYPCMSVYLSREKLRISGKRRLWDRDQSWTPPSAYCDEIHDVTAVNYPEVCYTVQKFPMLKQWYSMGINKQLLPKNKPTMILEKNIQTFPQILLSKNLLGLLFVFTMSCKRNACLTRWKSKICFSPLGCYNCQTNPTRSQPTHTESRAPDAMVTWSSRDLPQNFDHHPPGRYSHLDLRNSHAAFSHREGVGF